MPAHALPFLHIKPSLPSHTHASTPIVAIPCTYFHAHRGPPISTLAFTRFHAHLCPPIHTLAARRGPCINSFPRASLPSHTLLPLPLRPFNTLTFTLIAVIPYTCFPSLPLHALAFTPITAPSNTRFVSHCDPPIHSLPSPLLSHSCPLLSSHTLISSPIAAPQTIACLHLMTCEHAVYARARVSACERVITPWCPAAAGVEKETTKTGRPGSDGAARLGRGGPARTGL